MSQADLGLSVCPPLPERERPQRARTILDFKENGEHIHEAAEGWAMIEGSWLLWRADVEDDARGWQSWPIRHVLVVEWIPDA